MEEESIIEMVRSHIKVWINVLVMARDINPYDSNTTEYYQDEIDHLVKIRERIAKEYPLTKI